jgi:putative N6-adenine-specific DNA methylase
MLFAVCAPGLEHVLLSEMQALGLPGRAMAGGVEADGALPEAMRLNLWLRTASRVLMRLGEPVRATNFPELVRKASELPWERHLRKGARGAFRVTCRKSRLYHSEAVAERLHTALEARTGFEVPRAEVKEEAPEDAQLFLARFERDVCTVSVDTSGALLHQRGWRGPQAKAPLRETLAAAVLLAAGFRGEEPVCDPLCGSGTIAIEAALMAMRRAPGIARKFAFQRWPGFSARQWEHLVVAARKQERPLAVRIEASDQDAGAIAAARENASRAGVTLEIVQRRLTDLPPDDGSGLLACNPPYGVRVAADVRAVFRELEEAARRRPGWRVAMIATGAPGGRFESVLRTQNGGIPVDVLVSGKRLAGEF